MDLLSIHWHENGRDGGAHAVVYTSGYANEMAEELAALVGGEHVVRDSECSMVRTQTGCPIYIERRDPEWFRGAFNG